MDPNAPKPSAGDGAPSTATPAPPSTAEASSAPATPAEASSVQATTTAASLTASAATLPGGPSSGVEPETQAASASAHRVTPPLPAAYEMPDDYADETWFDKTKAWVEENPALAVVAAAGIGLVVGRLVIGLAPEPEPPSLADRIEKRARVLAKDAKKGGRRASRKAHHVAEDAGETVSDGLHRAAEALRDAAGSVTSRAEHGAERTRDAADTVSDAIKTALAGVAAKAVDEWVTRVKR